MYCLAQLFQRCLTKGLRLGKPDNIKNLLAPHCPFEVDVTKIGNVWWTNLICMYSMFKVWQKKEYWKIIPLLYAFCPKSKCYYLYV
jgi:hypothetical protein